MRIENQIGTGLLTILLTGCGVLGSGHESEAKQFLQKHVGEHYNECRGAFYGHETEWTSDKHVREVKSFEIVVKTKKLEETDKLNGIEWRGEAVLHEGPSRRFRPRKYSGVFNMKMLKEGKWSDYEMGETTQVQFVWKGGQIEVARFSGLPIPDSITPLPCGDIPQ